MRIKCFIYLTLAISFSCGKTSSHKSNKSFEVINLTDVINITWSVDSGKIARDSAYYYISSHFEELKMDIVEVVADTHHLNIQTKEKEEKVKFTKGVLAFMLIDEFVVLPYSRMLDFDFDLWTHEYPYPIGLLSYVANHPDTVQAKLGRYLTTKDTISPVWPM